MSENGDISVYEDMDPDSIYFGLPDNSITFFYIPSNQKLYLQTFPETHNDMLAQDPDLFRDVYANFLKLSPTDPVKRDVQRAYSSRGQALKHGRAILGRIGIDGTTPLIAFWNNRLLNSVTVESFLAAFYKKKPLFKQFENSTVLLLPGKSPQLVSQLSKTPIRKTTSAQRKIALNQPSQKKFEIGGQQYSLADLQMMRAAVHTSGKTDPALCHPDLEKYPELKGYKPMTCIQPSLTQAPAQSWRQAGRLAGMPYLHTYEGSFRHWLDIRESLGFTTR